MTEFDQLQASFTLGLIQRMGMRDAITYIERLQALSEQHRIALGDLLCYYDVQEKGDADLVAISPLIHTHAIISGINYCGHEKRWCYDSYNEAKAALDAWDGTGEPQGWTRSPYTGRRRDKEGNEWINW